MRVHFRPIVNLTLRYLPPFDEDLSLVLFLHSMHVPWRCLEEAESLRLEIHAAG